MNRTFRWGSPRARGLVCLVFWMIAGGCAPVPVTHYDLLATSTRQIWSGTTETDTRIEKIQRQFAVETAKGESLTRETFEPAIDGQTFDVTPDLRFREAALYVLVKYTQLLYLLAKGDSEREIDKAAEELAGSLKTLSLSISSSSASESSAGILVTTVDMLEGGVAGERRVEALKMVMDRSQKDVERLAQIVNDDIRHMRALMKIMLQQILEHQRSIRPPAGSALRVKFDMEVAALIDEVRQIQEALDTLDSAVKRVPGAHADIRDIFDGKSGRSESLRALIRHEQSIRAFYRNLK